MSVKKTLMLAALVAASGFTLGLSAHAQTSESASSSAAAPRGPGGPGGQGGGGGRMFDEQDANKDGALDKTEAKGRLLENFDTIDANKDGKITREELKAAREKMGPRPGGQGGQGQQPAGQ